MTCSPARIAANRANALRSTGPKTEQGKAASRANALKHGFAAEVLRTPDEADMLERSATGEGDGPKLLAGWLEGEVAVLTMRIDRAHRAEDRERERAALRAESCWDDDRRREAERIGAGLARNPGRVVGRLRGTVQGCAWLILRWEWLRDAAHRDGGWTAEQAALASDLQGIPGVLRGKAPGPDGQGALAGAKLRELGVARDALAGLDAFDRETVRKGLDDGATPELRRLLRYEAALHRRFRWCREQLSAGSAPPARPAPEAPPAPARPVAPRPAPAPPDEDDLEDFSDLDALFGLSAGSESREGLSLAMASVSRMIATLGE